LPTRPRSKTWGVLQPICAVATSRRVPRDSRPRSVVSASRRFETSLKRLKCAKSGHTRIAWLTGQIDPLLPSKIGPANGMEARESGFRQGVALHEGRLFRNGGEAPSQGLATKPEAGRERIITLLSPSAHHTRRTGPGGEGSARGASGAARTRTGRARRIFGRPHRLVRERQRNLSRMDSQSNEPFSWCSPTAGSSDFSSARSASGAP